MGDSTLTAIQHVDRRLRSATTFSGDLVCKMDPSMPLNLTDLSQEFRMRCDSPTDWWTLIGWGVAGFVIAFFVWSTVSEQIKERRKKRLEEEEAARNGDTAV